MEEFSRRADQMEAQLALLHQIQQQQQQQPQPQQVQQEKPQPQAALHNQDEVAKRDYRIMHLLRALAEQDKRIDSLQEELKKRDYRILHMGRSLDTVDGSTITVTK